MVKKKIEVGFFGTNKDLTGGTNTFFKNLNICFNLLSKQINFIDLERNDCDVDSVDLIFFPTLGVPKEKKNKQVQEQILKRFDKISGKKPVVLICHSAKEHKFYPLSFELMSELGPSIIMNHNNNPQTHQIIAKHYNSGKIVHFNLPFKLLHEFPIKVKKISKKIVSPSLLGSEKRNVVLLELYDYIENFDFDFYGEEKGMYWFYNLSKHRNYNKTKLLGKYDDYKTIYENRNFCIDTSFHFKKIGDDILFDSDRLQYVEIEAISEGVVPILFDIWTKELQGFKLIEIPSPKVNGLRLEYNFEKIAQIIDSAEYSKTEAESNFKIIKEFYSCETFSKVLLKTFKELL